jgi:hypothetical protein
MQDCNLLHAKRGCLDAHADQKVKIALRGSDQYLATSALLGLHSLSTTQSGWALLFAVNFTNLLLGWRKSQSMQ